MLDATSSFRSNYEIYGKITAAPEPASVPEPGVMTGLGLLGIYFIARSQGQKAKAVSRSK